MPAIMSGGVIVFARRTVSIGASNGDVRGVFRNYRRSKCVLGYGYAVLPRVLGKRKQQRKGRTMTSWTNGSYCPACAETIGGSVVALSEWERLNRGKRCHLCHEELMPLEIDGSEAYAAHCMNNHWD